MDHHPHPYFVEIFNYLSFIIDRTDFGIIFIFMLNRLIPTSAAATTDPWNLN